MHGRRGGKGDGIWAWATPNANIIIASANKAASPYRPIISKPRNPKTPGDPSTRQTGGSQMKSQQDLTVWSEPGAADEGE